MSYDQIHDLLDQQYKAFEAFKGANQDRHDKHAAEISRLEKEIDDLVKRGRPMGVDYGGVGGRFSEEQKQALDRFIRTGDGSNLEIEGKAMSTGGGVNGGYLVPKVLADQIYSLMRESCPMRELANVVQPKSGNYIELVCSHGGGVTHAGETDQRAATTTPGFPEVTHSMGEAFVNWPVSQRLIDDSAYDLVAFLLTEAPGAIGVAQNEAFTTGNGTNRAKGFLSYTQTAEVDGIRDFGKVQVIATGVADNFKTASATVSPADDLLAMIFALRPGHRKGAAWQMNAATLAAVSKWKNQSGDYIWKPGTAAGLPSTLFGLPVFENEHMPAVGAGATPIALGNWKKAYTIVDRTLTVLRDPYTNKPFVNLYLNSYYGGGLRDSEAVKLLKIGA
jgi:HK97 family phage major capsid protein